MAILVGCTGDKVEDGVKEEENLGSELSRAENEITGE